MNKAISIVYFFFLFPYQLRSQVQPRENSSLNYRIVCFSFPSRPPADNYLVEIAAGNYTAEDSFKKHIVLSADSKTNKIIAEVPSFGAQYTWRIVSKESNSVNKSDLYHFSTATIPDVDTNINRLRITKTTEKYKDAYVFLNSTAALYDMNGRPVWYLPHTNELNFADKTIRDLKLTPEGTITFVVDRIGAYEVNYNGDILWKAPNTGIVNGDHHSENYHHNFTRLANGHYMVLGDELTPLDSTIKSPDNIPSHAPGHDTLPAGNTSKMNPAMVRKLSFGTIIEYDEMGNVVWSWRSAPYFRSSDVMLYGGPKEIQRYDVHQNSFFFDEKAQTIYVSFKNISRIIKLKYPEGTVVNTYGEIYRPGVPAKGNGLFCYQHSCKVSQKGYLYLYNNNSCNPQSSPQLLMMQEPLSADDPLKVVWKYDCPVEPLNENLSKMYSKTPDMTSGGNVIELPDESLFASMGSPFSHLFIVNKDKNILWNAIPEMWSKKENLWIPISQYRASIIATRNELENLIWNAQVK